MVFEHLPGGTLEDRFSPGQPLDDASTETHRGRDRRRARARARSRPRPPRPEADEHRLRRGRTGEDRRLRDRADERRRHADRGRNAARDRGVHVPRAGLRRAGHSRERRLLVRRHPLPHAHGGGSRSSPRARSRSLAGICTSTPAPLSARSPRCASHARSARRELAREGPGRDGRPTAERSVDRLAGGRGADDHRQRRPQSRRSCSAALGGAGSSLCSASCSRC